MENIQFEEVFIEKSEVNWFYCRVKENQFLGDCGPHNLLDMITIFKNWIELNKNR